jgi:hypothetical protein
MTQKVIRYLRAMARDFSAVDELHAARSMRCSRNEESPLGGTVMNMSMKRDRVAEWLHSLTESLHENHGFPTLGMNGAHYDCAHNDNVITK